MMLAKLPTLDLLKMKLFRKQCYDITVSFLDVTKNFITSLKFCRRCDHVTKF